MKIGLFLPNATFDLPGTREVGGIEVYALELGEQMQKRGHHVTLFGGKPKPGRAHRAIPFSFQLFDYIETQDIPKLGTRFRKLVQRLHFGSVSMNSLLEAHFDVVFIFKPYDFINACRWKSVRKELKVIMNYQGTDFFPTDRFWHQWLDNEYAVSPENARLAESRYGGTVPVIPNGVDTSLFQPDATQLGNGFHLLTTGRLVGWKGLRVLAKAIAEVPEIHWHVAGDGPELPWLQNHATEKNYADRVTWHGVLDANQVAHLMQTCHFFAQPSIDFDACPTAVLQAMSSGLVVAMSDKVGLCESFIPDRDFLLVSGGKNEWIACLQKLKTLSPEARRGLGSAARQAVIQSFAWPGICTRIEALMNTPRRENSP